MLSTTNFAPSDLYTSATNTATAVTAAPVGRTVELGRDRLEGDAFVPEFFQPSDFAVAGEDLVFGAFGITNLSAMAPGLSLAGIRLVIPDHAVGLPVLRTLSFVYVLPPLLRRSVWAYSSLFDPDVSAFPERVVGSTHCPFRSLLGVRSRCSLHTRAVTDS